MPVLQPCSKALKLGVGLFVLSLFVWQLLESRHEQAVTKLNKTSLEALLQHLKSEELVRRQLASGGPHADRAGGRNQQPNHAAFHFVSSGLVRHMAAAQARMHLERAMKLAAAEKRLRLALEVSDTITSSGRAAGLGSAERGGMEAAVEAAGAAAEALAALKAAHTAAEPPVTFGVQLSCGSANPCGLWQVHGPQAATAPATAASASMLATRAPLPADAETGREPQSRTVSTPEAGCPAGGAAGSGDAAEGHGSEGDPAAMAAVAGAARTPDGGADVSDAGMEGVRKPPQCPAAAAVVAAAHHGDRPEAGALAAAACGDTAAATSAGVAQAEQGEAAAEPAAPLPATLYRRVVGGAAWLTSRLPPLLPLTAGGRFDLWYSSQVQLLALMPSKPWHSQGRHPQPIRSYSA